MTNNKKGLSMALAALMAAGTLFNGNIVADAAKKKSTKKPVKKVAKKKAPVKKVTVNYTAANTAVAVLENGIKKYGLTKPENLAYSKAKLALAQAEVAKLPAGTQKTALLNRISLCSAVIAQAPKVVATVVSVENPADMTVAEGAEAKLPATVKAVMSDNTSKELNVVWDKTVDTAKAADTTLTGRVEGTDKTVTMKVTVKHIDAEITAVTPLSLKQVKIEFNKPIVDDDLKNDVEDIDNYDLYDKDKDEVDNVIKEVKLDDSKKFAILTFADEMDSKEKNFIIENQEKYTLKIDKDIFGKEISQEIQFKDLELPKVENVEVVGQSTIKVSFSEPMKPYNLDKVDEEKGIAPKLDKDDFTVTRDGKELSISRVDLVNNNKDANIVIGTKLKDGEKLNIKVKGTVQDYAGLSAVSETKEATTKEDKNSPQLVGFKNIDSDKVTLVFDKDIQFKGNEDLVASKDTNSGYLKNFYHTSDSKEDNRATKVTIDGKEIVLEFDDDHNLPSGSSYIYVKSEALESRWKVKNDKLSIEVSRNKDNNKPEVVKVEQDSNDARKIHVRFSEKVKDSKDEGGALKTSNYTIKDNEGKETKVTEVAKDGSSEKEYVLKISRDLDADLKYTLTVKNVEDRTGNTIKEVTKDFAVTDKDAVDIEDVKITMHDVGKEDQKIAIDFGEKMTNGDDKFSTVDLGKYTLRAYRLNPGVKPNDAIKNNKLDASKVTEYKIFDGKSTVNVSDCYKADIKSAKDGRSVELQLPCSKKGNDLRDKSYDLSKDDLILEVEISKVKDSDGNVTTGSMCVAVKNADTNNTTWIEYKKSPRVTDPQHIWLRWKDKIDVDMDDIYVVAADNEKDAYEAALHQAQVTDPIAGYGVVPAAPKNATVLKISDSSNKENADRYTELNITLSKEDAARNKVPNTTLYDDSDLDHVFTYDGKYLKDANNPNSKQYVYLCVVPSDTKKHIPQSKNDDDTPVKSGAKYVWDGASPEIVKNDLRSENSKYLGMSKGYGYNKDNDDEAVEYYINGSFAAVVLTFEEDIDPKSVTRSAFSLDDDEDAFNGGVIYDAYVPANAKNKVVIIVSGFDGESGNGTRIAHGSRITMDGTIYDGSFYLDDETDFAGNKNDNSLSKQTFSTSDFFAPLTTAQADSLDILNHFKAAGATVTPADPAVKTATDAVIKAEVSKLQADVDAAKKLVDALPAGADKDTLSKRLNAIVVVTPDTKTIDGVLKTDIFGNKVVTVAVTDSTKVTKVALNGTDLVKEDKYTFDGNNVKVIINDSSKDTVKITVDGVEYTVVIK